MGNVTCFISVLEVLDIYFLREAGQGKKKKNAVPTEEKRMRSQGKFSVKCFDTLLKEVR